jgi:hypothetical protein
MPFITCQGVPRGWYILFYSRDSVSGAAEVTQESSVFLSCSHRLIGIVPKHDKTDTTDLSGT